MFSFMHIEVMKKLTVEHPWTDGKNRPRAPFYIPCEEPFFQMVCRQRLRF